MVLLFVREVRAGKVDAVTRISLLDDPLVTGDAKVSLPCAKTQA
jgi:hypothetical protein